jgi:hypothetical protein
MSNDIRDITNQNTTAGSVPGGLVERAVDSLLTEKEQSILFLANQIAQVLSSRSWLANLKAPDLLHNDFMSTLYDMLREQLPKTSPTGTEGVSSPEEIQSESESEPLA